MNSSAQFLRGKKAPITGATGGIGRAVAQALVNADIEFHSKDISRDIADTVMYSLKQPKRAWTFQVNLRPLNPNKAV
ncbi:MAG: hypothetical protein GY839_14440 [candidate division Zixibacteria bacterium]|nr:hypothetical protein [candidate division Zixibacteria bacterium]